MADTRVPAHVQPYVTALGVDRTADFLMRFGGTAAYLSENPQPGSELCRFLGREQVIALARCVGQGHLRVPTAKPFLAAWLRDTKGLNNQQIARELHVTNVTVRSWFKAANDRQLRLFG